VAELREEVTQAWAAAVMVGTWAVRVEGIAFARGEADEVA
jgi:hypothetical protein